MDMNDLASVYIVQPAEVALEAVMNANRAFVQYELPLVQPVALPSPATADVAAVLASVLHGAVRDPV